MGAIKFVVFLCCICLGVLELDGMKSRDLQEDVTAALVAGEVTSNVHHLVQEVDDMRDLQEDIAAALVAGELTSNVTQHLVQTIANVDDVLILEVAVLVGNIILNLHQMGVNGSELQSLQTTINSAEAITVYQCYLSAHALLDHNQLVLQTQGHLTSDLTLVDTDRELLAASQVALDERFVTGLELSNERVTSFNSQVNTLLEGLEGPLELETRLSLAAVNRVLRNTKNDIATEKLGVDGATSDYIAALDRVIAQLPSSRPAPRLAKLPGA